MYSRHDLVWLSADGWNPALAAAEAGHVEAIGRWRDARWPLIVTRRHPGAAHDALCLGLSAPSNTGRLRIALTVAMRDVVRHQAPPLLAQVIAHAPRHWRAALADLGAAMQLRVYGSLALQSLTDQQYLRPGSDIDLLFEPDSCAQLEHGVQRLTEAADVLPLDGEIVFPGGAAVAWKEWRSGAARVLVKHRDRVCLAPPASLLEGLAR